MGVAQAWDVRMTLVSLSVGFWGMVIDLRKALLR